MDNGTQISQESYLIALQQKVNQLLTENLTNSAYIVQLEKDLSDLRQKTEDENDKKEEK